MKHTKMLVIPALAMIAVIAIACGSNPPNTATPTPNVTGPAPANTSSTPTSADEQIINRIMGELPPADQLYLVDVPLQPNTPLTLALHGGPAPVLATSDFAFVEMAGMPIAYVRQYQMLFPSCIGFKVTQTAQGWNADGLVGVANEVTTQRSRECFLGSVAILRKVVQHFQGQGVKLNLIAHSIGSFISNKYIATYTTQDFVNVVLGGVRLDMPIEFVNIFHSGRQAFFVNGTTIEVQVEFMLPPGMLDTRTLPGLEIEGKASTLTQTFTSASDLSSRRLQSSVARERYSKSFATLDLANLTYVIGRLDTAVGRLTASEQAVLEASGATVLFFDEGHNLPSANTPILGILSK